MDDKQELTEWISRLRKSDKIIIVEGKKDKKALESLGISNIVTLNKNPVYKIIENVAKDNKKAVILTDLDKEGKKLYGKLNSGLQRLGVEVDNYFREFLFRKTRLRQIEGICTYCLNRDVFY